MPTLLTISETAHRLSVATITVRRLIDRGDLEIVDLAPAGSARRTIRISEAALATLISGKTAAMPAAQARREEKLREIEWLEQHGDRL